MREDVKALPIIQELMAKQKKTMEAHEQRERDGLASFFTSGPRFSPFVPMIVKKAKGCRFTDLDGNEYIDIAMSYGPLILGHAPDVVVKAVQEAVTLGASVVVGNEFEYKLAKLILDNVASAERLFFTNSGTEATMHAIKVARAYTGRPKIAKFEGGFHGTHPDVMISSNLGTERRGPKDKPESVPDEPGVCPRLIETTMVLPRDNPAAFDIIREHAKELACVIVEPVASGWPKPNVEYLKELREVTTKAGVVLIFDEVVSGFRTCFGGAQDRWNVIPDMSTFGKIIGGGLSLGAVVGKREILEMAVTSGDPAEDVTTKVHTIGTNAGNIVSCAAGFAQMNYLKQNEKTVYPYLREQGERLREEVQKFTTENNIPMRIMGMESAFVCHFLEDDPEDMRQLEQNTNYIAEKLLSYYMRRYGIHMPDIHAVFISTAHKPEDIDALIGAFKSSLTDMRQDGWC
jgi:glutamate-1-semialdehyde 2,1-aminomutase